MSRFNASTGGSRKTRNHEGGAAYKLEPKQELYSAVCTTMLAGNKYYESNDDRMKRIQGLLDRVPADFSQKLAVYARNNMYLRSVPVMLVVELAKRGKVSWKAVSKVIRRPDEITEILAYYQKANGRKGVKKLNKLSQAISRGIKTAFEDGRFDAYQLAKYNRDTEVKLRDAMFLTHPKPADEGQAELFKMLAEDTLPIPETWEVELSKAGGDKERKRAVWEGLIDSKKLGYMATIRNLRNMLDVEISTGHIEKVCQYIANENAVKNSKQFPFRWYAAYKELEGYKSKTGMVTACLNALEDAVIIAAKYNIPAFSYTDRVCVACDVSGSMNSPLSDRSKMRNYDVGLVLGMMLQHRCKNVITGIFGTEWKIKNLPQHNILANARKMDHFSSEVGWSTNGYLVVRDLRQRKVVLDKIMIFTDEELYDSRRNPWATEGESTLAKEVAKYKKDINPDVEIMLFNLAGYGTSALDITQPGIYQIAGWSPEVFRVIEAIKGQGDAIKMIEDIEL